MSISIYRVADDGLSRQRWDFNIGLDYSNGVAITLVAYSIERRKSARTRFSKAPSPERWVSSDERRYNSGLSRPDSVPADVLAEARDKMAVRYFIGWITNGHEITAKGERK